MFHDCGEAGVADVALDYVGLEEGCHEVVSGGHATVSQLVVCGAVAEF